MYKYINLAKMFYLYIFIVTWEDSQLIESPVENLIKTHFQFFIIVLSTKINEINNSIY